MDSYLHRLNLIFNYGTPKHPSRQESENKDKLTTNSTIGIPNILFNHELEHGFPLLTTRKINWQGLVGELRSFLEGKSNNKDFEDNGCNFWKPWARKDGDLGPVYGVQWNKYNQLSHVLYCLRNRPTDRRMVVNAWNPPDHPSMVLPPCHLMWVVTVYDNYVNTAWIQRSCDFPIGVPYNIGSYALLTHLLASWAGMKPGSISCIFCDAHIYENQMQGVKKQLKRKPKALPNIRVWFEDNSNFNSWQCSLDNYEPQSHINFGELEV